MSDDAVRPGENCWRRERAGRAAFLVDADAYFRALAAALLRAERSVFVLGWDIHSRVSLVEEGEAPETRLGALLDHLASERPDLQVRILCWDFAMLYVFERESFPVFRLDWKTHRRVHFRLDDDHPVGASHHQKIVVIDDSLAFSGGIDLTAHRWDTSEHRPDEPRRTTPEGDAYDPFHDVQLAVDGPAARAVAELARTRWRRATGEDPPPPGEPRDVWPEGLSVHLRDVPVAIARTEPAWRDREEVREVESLFLDSIRSARRFLYVENQYLSSSRIGEALAERLREPDGPEVVIVSPLRCAGWLEEVSMGVLRARLMGGLREADRHDRLRVVWPRASRDPEVAVNVHAKVMVVDDRLARVGSANLSNRSLGLDTECDLLLEAETDAHREAIVRFRDGLLAEHLGVAPERVAAERAATGSLVAALDRLAGGDRTLVRLEAEIDEWIEDVVPDERLIDPERPIGAEELAERLLASEAPEPRRAPLRRLGWTVAALLALAAAWRFTPLSEWLEPERLASLAAPLARAPWGWPVAVGVFGLATLAMVPVTLAIVASALLFGMPEGAGVALAGALLGASLGYAIGHALWRDALRRVGGRSLNRLSRVLAQRGILAVAAVRIVPIAPFTVVNLVAGASHVSFRDFALGTLLAMGPGILAMTWLSDRVSEVMRGPDRGDPAAWLGIAGVAALALGAFAWLRRRFARRGIAPARAGGASGRSQDSRRTSG